MHELDQTQLRLANDRIASRFDTDDFICIETGRRLLERLDLITLEPMVILDLGAGTGRLSAELQSLYPNSRVIALDWSSGMLEVAAGRTALRLCADSHRLPLLDNSVDLVISNLMLPGAANPTEIFSEAQRVLKTPGLILFNTLGPDTLKSLRRAWADADSAPHVHPFVDMHNVGDALVQAGFCEPVMDVEQISISYREIARLFSDLRAVAATNRLSARRKGLTSPRLWQKMLAAGEALKNSDGSFPVQVELITGQAWKGVAGPGVHMSDGEAGFPLSRLSKRSRN